MTIGAVDVVALAVFQCCGHFDGGVNKSSMIDKEMEFAISLVLEMNS